MNTLPARGAEGQVCALGITWVSATQKGSASCHSADGGGPTVVGAIFATPSNVVPRVATLVTSSLTPPNYVIVPCCIKACVDYQHIRSGGPRFCTFSISWVRLPKSLWV